MMHSQDTVSGFYQKFSNSHEYNIADKKMSISIYLKSLVQKELDKEHSKMLKDPQKLMEFL